MDGNGDLDFEEFKIFLERLRVRPEIEEIFVKFHKQATKDGSMTPEEFLTFLRTVQKEDGEKLTLKDAERIIAEVETKVPPKEKEKNVPHLYITGFANYLSSARFNSVFKPEKAQVYQVTSIVRYSTPIDLSISVLISSSL